MKRIRIHNRTDLTVNQCFEGETLEQKVERIVTLKEPITDGAPLIYTERKDGVVEDYNIRTDRFEVAIQGMDTVSRAELAKRMERHKPKEVEKPADGESIA